MSRSLWPPRTVEIPVSVIRAETIPNAAFRLYCKLRSLALGQGPSHPGELCLQMKLPALLDAVELTRTRLLEYARVLKLHKTLLRWSCVGENFECAFPDPNPGIPESGNPEKRDSASLKSSIKQDSDSIKEGAQIPESGIPGKRDSARKKAADPRTASPEIQLYRAIVGRYPSAVNYDEVIAAAAGRTREQLEPFYREWSARGYNPASIKWLTEWSINGIPGKNGLRAAPSRPTLSADDVAALRLQMRAQKEKP